MILVCFYAPDMHHNDAASKLGLNQRAFNTTKRDRKEILALSFMLTGEMFLKLHGLTAKPFIIMILVMVTEMLHHQTSMVQDRIARSQQQ